MNGPPVLAVVVVHASSGPWSAAALAALDRQTYPTLDVAIVTVGEAQPPSQAPGSRPATTVTVPSDTGFGDAVNAGVRAAADEHHAYILTLHDDAAPTPDVVEVLVARAEAAPDSAAVGTKLVEWEEPDVLQEVGGSIDRFAVRRSGLEAHEVDHGQHDGVGDVLFSSAACLLIRRHAFEQAGGFDPAAWPLYDEVDLCWRFRASGARVLVAPEARVRHAAALSRGLRTQDDPRAAYLGIREDAERGRLWFMLRHYAPLSLAALLPQYLLSATFRIGAGLVLRDFWRVRSVVGAWFRVVRELPAIWNKRRQDEEHVVGDQDLLALAARRAAAERRSERVELFARAMEVVRRGEAGALRTLRDPLTWVGVGAAAVLLLTLREVLTAGAFTLGELRPPPSFGEALEAYTARIRSDGFDLVGPGAPGILLLGAIRWLAMGSAGLAGKLLLLLPFVVAATGAFRLGRVIGLARRGRQWLAVLGAVNPATLHLVQHGEMGALFMWAASMWVAAAVIGAEPAPTWRERSRRGARWALGWAAVVALHPPALLWLTVLSVGLTLTREGGEGGERRWQLPAIGVAGSVLLTVPWSLQLGSRSPFFGLAPGMLSAGEGGVAGATLGSGWAFAAWVVVAIIATVFVGGSRTMIVLVSLLAAAWAAGVLELIPPGTGIAAAGWCIVVVLAFVARRVGDELPRYGLGVRHAAVIGIVVGLAAAWIGAAVPTVAAGTPAHTTTIVPPAGAEDLGRVVWIDEAELGLRLWGTRGFAETPQTFPAPKGPEDALVGAALEAAREGRTHRLGGLLALADVSHIVTMTPQTRLGLDSQADLTPQEEQAGAQIYRNDAWVGPGMVLATAPDDPVSPGGVADTVRDVRRLDARVAEDGTVRVGLPEDITEGAVYLAVGHRAGWDVGGESAEPTAGGVWIDAPLAGERITASPPGRWWMGLYPLQGLLLAGLFVLWLGAVYLTGPQVQALRPLKGEPQPVMHAGALALIPIVVLMVAGAGGWLGVRAAEPGPVLSSAWYCPPIGGDFSQQLAIANPSDERIEYVVRTDLIEAPIEEGTIPARGRVSVELEGDAGSVIEAYGQRIGVAMQVAGEGLADASLCAPQPRQANLFPEGGRFATRATPRLFEAYILHNPFPELARASVRFIAPDEVIAPPALQDVRVEPGGQVLVDPEGQFEPMLDLSAEVTVWQGRAIVARRFRTVEQITWSLGVDPQRVGVLSRADTLDAETALIGLNPSDQPARVSVFGAGAEAIPREEFDIPPRSRAMFEVGEVAPNLSDVLVRVTSNQPVALETLVVPEGRRTVSLLPPVQPAGRWLVPLGEGRTLLLINPGERHVRVDFARLGLGPEIESTSVSPGGTARVELEGDDPFGVLVTVRGGDVTVAAVGEQGTVAGVPLR